MTKSLSSCIPLWLHQLVSPKYFLSFAEKFNPYLYVISLILLIVGCIGGLVFAPTDYQQGNSYRIIYIHVPAAIFSEALYVLMAILGFITLVWRAKIAAIIARPAAKIGATMTLLTLVTGAIWGQPTWGTWWAWDPRLTSVLLLFFLYLGYIALDSAFDDREKANKACALLALIGVAIVPFIKASVYFFNSLHQKSTLFAKGGPAMPMDMLLPLLIMIAAFAFFVAANILSGAINEILDQKLAAQAFMSDRK